MNKTQKTTMPKYDPKERKSYVINADGKILGKVATKAAKILRGKHKTTYTPHMDMGDNIIIINAEKIRVTGKKPQQKVYQRYSGYPSGQKSLTFEQLIQKAPTQVVRLAVNRMIPKGPLGNRIRARLRVYKGDKHPHDGQNPTVLDI